MRTAGKKLPRTSSDGRYMCTGEGVMDYHISKIRHNVITLIRVER